MSVSPFTLVYLHVFVLVYRAAACWRTSAS